MCRRHTSRFILASWRVGKTAFALNDTTTGDCVSPAVLWEAAKDKRATKERYDPPLRTRHARIVEYWFNISLWKSHCGTFRSQYRCEYTENPPIQEGGDLSTCKVDQRARCDNCMPDDLFSNHQHLPARLSDDGADPIVVGLGYLSTLIWGRGTSTQSV